MLRHEDGTLEASLGYNYKARPCLQNTSQVQWLTLATEEAEIRKTKFWGLSRQNISETLCKSVSHLWWQAHAYEPSYSGGISGRMEDWGQPWAKTQDPTWKLTRAEKSWGHGQIPAPQNKAKQVTKRKTTKSPNKDNTKVIAKITR
jgi:hypothetical protein